jgi:serine/threonine protein kinase
MAEPANYQHYQHYQVLRREDGSLWELGKGAMGITYKAFDTNLRCTVALKVINNKYLSSDVARQRFLREARAAAALRHQNVASVFHLGTDHDSYFYAMEYIDGQTLASYIENEKKGPLDPVEALNICLQVTRALAAAARQQLVHRDLKPANLMLVDEDGERIVKVIDFGLAKSAKIEGEDSATLTQAGGFVGTPHFASPEQLEERDIDIRSDIYSLGVTLYYMLTGRPPFSGSVPQIMSQHLYKPVPVEPLQNLPQCVVDLVLKMMDKDREKRPQTPNELRREIVACLEQLQVGPSPGTNVAAGQVVPVDHTETTAGGEANLTGPRPLKDWSVIGERYQLVREIQEVAQGRKFYANDLRDARGVSLLIFSEQFLADKQRFTSIEQEVEKLQANPHESIRQAFSLESTDQYSYLVEEFVVGPTLLGILRARGVLTAQEVALLLEQLAPVADHASAHQLQSVDLTLAGVQLTYPDLIQAAITPVLLQQSLQQWPPFKAKVAAVDFSVPASDSATWSGATTLVGNVHTGGAKNSYTRLLSLLAYELLGGPRSTAETTGRVSPVPCLSEAGNTVLRHGIADGFSSATEMSQALIELIGGRQLGSSAVPSSTSTATPPAGTAAPPAGVAAPPSTVTPPGGATSGGKPSSSDFDPVPVTPDSPDASNAWLPQTMAPHPAPVPSSNVPSSGSTGAVVPPPLPPQYVSAPEAKRSRFSVIGLILIIFLALFILGALGFGGFSVWRALTNSAQSNNTVEKATPTPVPTVRPTPEIVTPVPTPRPIATPTPEATPQPTATSPSSPVSTPVATATPPPTGEDEPAASLKAADDLEKAGDWVGAMKLLNVALERNPDAPELRARLENLLSEVRSSKTKVTPDNFSILRPGLESSARGGVVQAMLLLAENTWSTEPDYALDWYEQAAAKGNVIAKRQAGILLSRHHNAGDDAKAFNYLHEAADAGDAYAKYCVAECYYFGKLVPKDKTKALSYAQEAAALRNVMAMDLLGTHYREQHDYESAIAYFKQAIALQYPRSMANLGVMYVLGEGVPKDVPRALGLFKLAADRNDPEGLYFYGMALIDGINGVRNHATGVEYVRRAAEAGYVMAVDWCRRNKVAFQPNHGTPNPNQPPSNPNQAPQHPNQGP